MNPAIPQTFSLFGLSVYTYGLIVGIATMVGVLLVEKRLQLERINKKAVNVEWLSEDKFWQGVMVALIFGIFGARLWHVVTDFYLYENSLVDAVKIWQGGLSILGGVAGGLFGVWGWLKFGVKSSQAQVKTRFFSFIDLAVFGLPVSQAIGRLGNFTNQELYGLPSQLPWAISIDSQFRLAGYEMFSKFHPLFAYEAILMVIFLVWLWWSSVVKKQTILKIGTGGPFLIYVWYYSLIRFGLDFLRIDKVGSFLPGLGKNQLVLILVFALATVLLMNKYQRKNDQT